jgi:hypothetical protein
VGLWIVTTRVLYIIDGPVTVAVERGGFLIRWLKPIAGSKGMSRRMLKNEERRCSP